MAQRTRHAETENRNADGRSGILTDSPMMQHLIEALKRGEDIGHYGKLTFVMIAQWFMDDDEMVKLLAKGRDMDESGARALVAEVKGHGYNPPKRNQILEWQQEQDFPICPNPDDPGSCNVYSELQFPDEVYDNIGHFWEEKARAEASS